jgi:hypothetical protein
MARAADVEVRNYRVFIDGKAAGSVRMVIQRLADGSVSMRCDASTSLTIGGIIKTYSYVYHGQETWKDQRLVRLDSTANDNGKRLAVSAVAEPKGVRVIIDHQHKGEARMVSRDVWLTSYWHLPDPKLRNDTLALLDSDTGKALSAKLQFIGAEKRAIAGSEATLGHFKLTGEVEVDLWYDGSERLARQEWDEGSHHAVIEVTSVEE